MKSRAETFGYVHKPFGKKTEARVGDPTIAERLALRVLSLEKMYTIVAPLFPQSQLLDEINMSLDVMRELLEYQRYKDHEAGVAEAWSLNFRRDHLQDDD